MVLSANTHTYTPRANISYLYVRGSRTLYVCIWYRNIRISNSKFEGEGFTRILGCLTVEWIFICFFLLEINIIYIFSTLPPATIGHLSFKHQLNVFHSFRNITIYIILNMFRFKISFSWKVSSFTFSTFILFRPYGMLEFNLMLSLSSYSPLSLLQPFLYWVECVFSFYLFLYFFLLLVGFSISIWKMYSVCEK